MVRSPISPTKQNWTSSTTVPSSRCASGAGSGADRSLPREIPTVTFPCCAFASIPSRPSLSLLLNHDDEKREYAYQAGAEESLKRAGQHGWTVVSLKNDWKTVFVDR